MAFFSLNHEEKYAISLSIGSSISVIKNADAAFLSNALRFFTSNVVFPKRQGQLSGDSLKNSGPESHDLDLVFISLHPRLKTSAGVEFTMDVSLIRSASAFRNKLYTTGHKKEENTFLHFLFFQELQRSLSKK